MIQGLAGACPVDASSMPQPGSYSDRRRDLLNLDTQTRTVGHTGRSGCIRAARPLGTYFAYKNRSQHTARTNSKVKLGYIIVRSKAYLKA